MTRTVLITGAGGFIGGALAHALRGEGNVVCGVDDLSAPGARLEPGVRQQRVEDMTDAQLAGVDTVIHLAASKRVDASFRDIAAVGRNVLADAHLFGLAYKSKVKQLIFASSCEVYGPSQTRANREADAPAPVSPYAVGKYASERLLATTRDLYPDTDVRVVRLFNVYGPGEALPAVIPTFLLAAHLAQPLTIDGSGTQMRDFSFIADTVAMLVTLTRAPCSPPVVNIGSGIATSVADIASTVSAYQRTPSTLTHRPPRPNEVSQFCSDTSLWESTFGGVVSRPLADGIGRCVESAASQPNIVAA